MNLKDLHGVVHCPREGLEEDNATFQTLIDAGFAVTIATICRGDLIAKEMTDAPVTCIACIAQTRRVY